MKQSPLPVANALGFPPNSPIICPIWLQSGELRDRGGLVTYSSAFLRVEALSLVLSLAKQ